MSTTNGNGLQGFKALYPRLLHFGVTYGDLERICAQPQDWDTWSRSLAEQADQYERAGDDAWRKGRKVSAMQWWRRATDYFHYAQIRMVAMADKRELQGRSRRNFVKLAALLNPPAARLEVPFGSSLLPGYFRMACPGAPCTILIGGLDSAKEVELHYFAEGFLARGHSVFFFDGPGQGELCGRLPMMTNFEGAVSTVIDYLLDHVEIDGQRLGLFGVSFGGYLACRAAASDGRIKACVSLGGFFDAQIFARLSPLATAIFKRTFGLNERQDLCGIAPQISLQPLRGCMDRPLLILHGRDDHLVDEGQVAALSEWACGPKRIWIMDDAEHVCTNRFSECLPEMGDWMSEQLAVPMSPSVGMAEGWQTYEQEIH